MLSYFRNKWVFPILLTTLLTGPNATAEQTMSLALNQFEAAASYIHQSDGQSASVMLGYSPQYKFDDSLKGTIKLQAGPHRLDDKTTFAAVHALAGAEYTFTESWSAQVLAGTQYWTCKDCGSHFLYGAEIKYYLPMGPFSLISAQGFSLQALFDDRSTNNSQTWNLAIFFSFGKGN